MSPFWSLTTNVLPSRMFTRRGCTSPPSWFTAAPLSPDFTLFLPRRAWFSQFGEGIEPNARRRRRFGRSPIAKGAKTVNEPGPKRIDTVPEIVLRQSPDQRRIQFGRSRLALRIAMVAPPWYELPPNGYGGLELICSSLVDALVNCGHDVTLFGAGERSGTKAAFVPTTPDPQYARLGADLPAALHIARVNECIADGRFDVVHDHTTCGPLTAAQRRPPTVVTVHGPADGEFGDFLAALGDAVHPVAISHSQRRRRPELA